MEINRLVCVSNRLPIVLEKGEDWQVKPASGGLVSALEPVLKNRGGMWVGWPGIIDDGAELKRALDSAASNAGYELHPVVLDEAEVDGFYYGFANEIIWPLFHSLPTRANFNHTYWDCYESANRKFAGLSVVDGVGSRTAPTGLQTGLLNTFCGFINCFWNSLTCQRPLRVTVSWSQ